jgi:hypothetical protein
MSPGWLEFKKSIRAEIGHPVFADDARADAVVRKDRL